MRHSSWVFYTGCAPVFAIGWWGVICVFRA
jgi:hypothetical protein